MELSNDKKWIESFVKQNESRKFEVSHNDHMFFAESILTTLEQIESEFNRDAVIKFLEIAAMQVRACTSDKKLSEIVKYEDTRKIGLSPQALMADEIRSVLDYADNLPREKKLLRSLDSYISRGIPLTEAQMRAAYSAVKSVKRFIPKSKLEEAAFKPARKYQNGGQTK
jgi:predicted protein tyrosine phosphatase